MPRLYYPAAAGSGRMEIVRQWRYRLTVRTEPSQGLNTGSIPVSATMFSADSKKDSLLISRVPCHAMSRDGGSITKGACVRGYGCQCGCEESHSVYRTRASSAL